MIEDLKKQKIGVHTDFVFDLGLLLLWFETDDLSLTCFLAAPVTTSKMVGSSFIRLKSRFLNHSSWQDIRKYNEMLEAFQYSI